MSEKYDGQLGEILSDLGHAVSFLDCVFGFLHRRTDFYRPEDGPPASHEDIEKVVLGIFRKWQERTETEPVSYSGDDLPVAQEYEVGDDSLAPGNRRILKAVSRKKKTGASERSEMAVDTPSSSVDIDSEMTDVSMTANVGSSSDEVCSSQDETGSLVDNVGSSTDETGCSGSGSSDDKCLGAPGVEAIAVSSSDCYNGAVRDNYRWSQTITDLDVQVIVGPNVQKGSTDVRVSVTSNTVRVETRDKEDEWKTVVDGELCWLVNREECIWSLVPGQYVQIHLEKTKERWWEALLKSEPKIDLTQIDASRPMDELSEEEHMKIEELMWNEQRKMKGLPTSQELGLSNILKDAWDKEGSPFKGRPYDPSLLSFASGSCTIQPDGN
ncbi:nudC domain-containing protein 3-like [Schistocerca nitens]|uniref:nudC domain-containing protein 3-like n=1 Tax=Schistocerca nitens TaxID=7011 RepID=UPI0021180FFE|nr:nudC domain-containing protein 3-like [Schistocerca nitens]